MQIEQPFEVLPLPHFCAAIKKHVLDMVSIHAEAKALAKREWPMTPSAMTPSMSPSPSQTVSHHLRSAHSMPPRTSGKHATSR